VRDAHVHELHESVVPSGLVRGCLAMSLVELRGRTLLKFPQIFKCLSRRAVEPAKKVLELGSVLASVGDN
jgi:hypothetical protein